MEFFEEEDKFYLVFEKLRGGWETHQAPVLTLMHVFKLVCNDPLFAQPAY